MPKPSYTTKKAVLAVLDFIVAVGIVIIIVLLLGLIGKVNKQQMETQKQVAATHADLQTSTATIEDDLKCLEQFFTLPNRQSLTIVDLRTCKIIDSTTGKSFVPDTTGQLQSTPASNSSQPAAANAPQTSSPTVSTTAPVVTPTPPDTRNFIEKAVSGIVNALKSAF